MRRTLPTTALILTLGCASDPGLDQQSFTGVALDEVRQSLGDPDGVERTVKAAPHVFGPIETIWSRMENGDVVVTWIYETRQGRKELYFVEGETQVAAEFFWYHDQSKNPVF